MVKHSHCENMMAALSDPKLQFMLKLRDFGKEKVKELKPDDNNCNQYIVAFIASEEEIEDRHNTLTEEAKGGKIDLEEKSYISNRLVVILNIRFWHGEARLLDPTRKIWKRVAASEQSEREMVFRKTNFVDRMKENFRSGVIGAPKIWLFSHFIPCTDPRHRCARLIEEYVKETGDEIILSYERPHDDTYEQMARAILFRNKDYITILLPWNQIQQGPSIVTVSSERMKKQLKRNKRNKRNAIHEGQLRSYTRDRETANTRCNDPNLSRKVTFRNLQHLYPEENEKREQ